MNFNVKKLVIYLSIIAIVTLVIGFSILSFTNKNNFNLNSHSLLFNFQNGNNEDNRDGKTYNINQEKKLSADGIKNISIDVTTAQINIIPEDRTDVQAIFTGNVVTASPYNEPQLKAEISGDSISIVVENKSNISFNFSSRFNLDIHVPKNYNNNFSVNVTTGKIVLNDMNLKSLKAKATTGDIEFKNINLDTLEIVCTTGNIDLDNIKSKSSTVSATTGKINISNLTGDLSGKVTTGKVNIEYSEFSNNIKFKAVTGSISLKLPKNAEFALDASVTTGNVKCDFPISLSSSSRKELIGVVKSDNNRIDLSAVTGSIEIIE